LVHPPADRYQQEPKRVKDSRNLVRSQSPAVGKNLVLNEISSLPPADTRPVN
jgi:hypothetical protein